jgi:hypothetical protein
MHPSTLLGSVARPEFNINEFRQLEPVIELLYFTFIIRLVEYLHLLMKNLQNKKEKKIVRL